MKPKIHKNVDLNACVITGQNYNMPKAKKERKKQTKNST